MRTAGETTMAQRPIDPAPRSYVAAVTLLRRSARGRESVPAHTTAADIERWLLDEALGCVGQLDLFEQFVWRLVAAGLPLDRASLHVGTLHPQLYGFAWNWNIADGLCDEVKVAESVLKSDGFLKSPLAIVLREGRALELDPNDEETARRFPLMADLKALEITQYLALPLGGAGYHNVATVATRQAGGFSQDELAAIRRLLALFALHVERHIALRISANVLDTYLGVAAGGQVLEGSIRRGAGTRIDAVIWSSDLRGFTDLADRLAPDAMIAVLNAYFDVMAGAVIAGGGEVLKFIGDGLLAVFPLDGDYGGRTAADAAIGAAEASEKAIAGLNAAPPAQLSGIEGWAPLRSGIGLHEGEVFFGNVGAPDRLDFTVIGKAVNAASRIEGLSKPLGRSLLVSAPVAAAAARSLESLGRHALRGVAEPVEIFAIPR
jgi:adenylate cyclase